MQKGLSPILMILILAGVTVLTGGAYYFGKITAPKNDFFDQNSMVFPSQQPQSTNKPAINTSALRNTTDETANWKTYTSDNYGYSFKYPSSFWIRSVTTYKKISDNQNVATIGDAALPTANTVASISVTDIQKKQGESLVDLMNSYMKDRIEYQIKKSRTIYIKNHSAIYLETTVNSKIFHLIFVETDGSNVLILNIINNSGITDLFQSDVNKILDTLQFSE